jgi:hypothetical protein
MAVEVSVAQMALTRNVEFMERSQGLIAKVAGTVLSESGGTPYHNNRAQYAQRVISSPYMATQGAAPQIVFHPNISSYTTYDEELKTSTTTAPDVNIENTIIEMWNALAGIDTPS